MTLFNRYSEIRLKRQLKLNQVGSGPLSTFSSGIQEANNNLLCGIRQFVEMSSASSFTIRVKTLDSTEYEVSVTNDTTVLELKRRLEELTGVSSERQRIIFRGRVLSDERNLGDYKIEQGNALHLVSRPVTTGTEDTSRTENSNVSSNEPPPQGMGIPRGASVFIGSMNIPVGADEVSGVAGSIIQSIQQMLRFAQSRSQFPGQNQQPQNIEQILRNTFLSARQIYQQLQQQISHTTQSTDTAFTQDLPSDMGGAYVVILQGLLNSCRLLEQFLESAIANLESQRMNANQTENIRASSSRVTTVLSLFFQLLQQILGSSRVFAEMNSPTNTNNEHRGTRRVNIFSILYLMEYANRRNECAATTATTTNVAEHAAVVRSSNHQYGATDIFIFIKWSQCTRIYSCW